MKRTLLYILIILGTISCSSYPETPEKLVEELTTLLSQGQCDEALELTTYNAKLVVQGTIDSGCEPYETTVDSVVCEIEDDEGICICYETRKDFGSFAFPYAVIIEDDKWKVKDNAKDVGMDESMFDE